MKVIYPGAHHSDSNLSLWTESQVLLSQSVLNWLTPTLGITALDCCKPEFSEFSRDTNDDTRIDVSQAETSSSSFLGSSRSTSFLLSRKKYHLDAVLSKSCGIIHSRTPFCLVNWCVSPCCLFDKGFPIVLINMLKPNGMALCALEFDKEFQLTTLWNLNSNDDVNFGATRHSFRTTFARQTCFTGSWEMQHGSSQRKCWSIYLLTTTWNQIQTYLVNQHPEVGVLSFTLQYHRCFELWLTSPPTTLFETIENTTELSKICLIGCTDGSLWQYVLPIKRKDRPRIKRILLPDPSFHLPLNKDEICYSKYVTAELDIQEIWMSDFNPPRSLPLFTYCVRHYDQQRLKVVSWTVVVYSSVLVWTKDTKKRLTPRRSVSNDYKQARKCVAQPLCKTFAAECVRAAGLTDFGHSVTIMTATRILRFEPPRKQCCATQSTLRSTEYVLVNPTLLHEGNMYPKKGLPTLSGLEENKNIYEFYENSHSLSGELGTANITEPPATNDHDGSINLKSTWISSSFPHSISVSPTFSRVALYFYASKTNADKVFSSDHLWTAEANAATSSSFTSSLSQQWRHCEAADMKLASTVIYYLHSDLHLRVDRKYMCDLVQSFSSTPWLREDLVRWAYGVGITLESLGLRTAHEQPCISQAQCCIFCGSIAKPIFEDASLRYLFRCERFHDFAVCAFTGKLLSPSHETIYCEFCRTSVQISQCVGFLASICIRCQRPRLC